MRSRSLIAAVTMALSPVSADAPPAATLTAAPATAVVRPIPAGLRLVRLPALDYTITIVPSCGTALEPAWASISVADTSISLDADALGAPAATVQLTVPGAQVAPVAVDGFCEAATAEAGNDEATERTTTRVDDAVTAHLSLRCANDERQAIVYASKPLAVTIECARDQAPSESSAAR